MVDDVILSPPEDWVYQPSKMCPVLMEVGRSPYVPPTMTFLELTSTVPPLGSNDTLRMSELVTEKVMSIRIVSEGALPDEYASAVVTVIWYCFPTATDDNSDENPLDWSRMMSDVPESEVNDILRPVWPIIESVIDEDDMETEREQVVTSPLTLRYPLFCDRIVPAGTLYVIPVDVVSVLTEILLSISDPDRDVSDVPS